MSGSYDNLGRLMLRDYSDTTPDVNFYYDGKGLGAVPAYSKGRTTKVTSSVSETRYTGFDVFGRLLSHEQVTDGQVYATSYVYNLSGAMIEETYPSGRKVRNTLDANGDLAAVDTLKPGGAWEIRADSFAYDSAGAVTAMRLGNNRWETAEYNSRLQVTRIGLGTAAGVQDVLRLDYGYATAGQTDNNGSLREQTITVPAAGATAGFTAVQSYGYDSLNRLQSASETVSGSQTWRQTFNYDRYGNRTFDAAGTTTLAQSNNVTNPVVNQANNRFSAGQGYNYDLAGNVTMNATGMWFLYDAENHQTEVRDAGGFVVGQYFYDGEGRRVKKVSATETTVFVYDGGGALVAEYSTSGNGAASVKYLTQDHLGSPRIITDQNGTVVSRTDFGAFGDETMTPQRTSGLGYAAADGVRQDYTGYQKDDESGLEFARARYYNPAHGRFTSVDPLTASASIRDPQTFNRYSYALNSPYKFTDPLGLLSISTGSCLPCKFADSGGGGGGVNPMGGGMFVLLQRDSAPVPDAHTNEAAEPSEATASHEVGQVAQQQTAPPNTQQGQAPQQQSAISGFKLLTSGANQVPDTPHPEVPNANNLGFLDTAIGGYVLLNVQVTFKEGTNIADYRHVRTAFILGSNETRTGSEENPSKSQTRIDGQNRFVYDNPGVNISGAPKGTLDGTTFAAVFVAGESNKKTGKIDSNVIFYGVKIAYGRDGVIDRGKSVAVTISRNDFIKLSGLKNPEKTLK